MYDTGFELGTGTGVLEPSNPIRSCCILDVRQSLTTSVVFEVPQKHCFN